MAQTTTDQRHCGDERGIGPKQGRKPFTLQTLPAWEDVSDGLVRHAFKMPWRDGTTHVVFEPLDLIARLGGHVTQPTLTDSDAGP